MRIRTKRMKRICTMLKAASRSRNEVIYVPICHSRSLIYKYVSLECSYNL